MQTAVRSGTPLSKSQLQARSPRALCLTGLKSARRYLLFRTVRDQGSGGGVASAEGIATCLVRHDQYSEILGWRHPHHCEILRVAACVIEGASARPWTV